MAAVIIDEIHLLGADRGPTLEVIASRMRFIAANTDRPVRFVGLSTALANARDLGDWLGIPSDSPGLFNFKPSVRPVPLEVNLQASKGVTNPAGQAFVFSTLSPLCCRPRLATRPPHAPARPIRSPPPPFPPGLPRQVLLPANGLHEQAGLRGHPDALARQARARLRILEAAGEPRGKFVAQSSLPKAPLELSGRCDPLFNFILSCRNLGRISPPTPPRPSPTRTRKQTRLTALDLIALAAAAERPRQFVRAGEEELQAALASAR